MSKAILILNEMPKSCIECKLGLMYGSYCAIVGDTYVTEGNKSSDCPLKPMPQKKHNNGGYRVIDGTEWFYDSEHDDGWNDCIDEILGGEE